MYCTILSFGYHYGTPEADITIDCRILRNPARIADLFHKTGLHRDVQRHVLDMPKARQLLVRALRLYHDTIGNGQSHITLAFGCSKGKHRSVALAQEFCEFMQREFPDDTFVVEHTERDKWPKQT